MAVLCDGLFPFPPTPCVDEEVRGTRCHSWILSMEIEVRRDHGLHSRVREAECV